MKNKDKETFRFSFLFKIKDLNEQVRPFHCVAVSERSARKKLFNSFLEILQVERKTMKGMDGK